MTRKDIKKEEISHWSEFKRALVVTWPHLLYILAFVAGARGVAVGRQVGRSAYIQLGCVTEPQQR